MMDLKKAIAQLHQQGVSIRSLVADMIEETARWKPDPDSWSILEVLNHLVDEEVFDFRRHSEHMLFTPDQPWPEIDPQGWIKERAYNQRKLNETLRNFERERANSITWLRELTERIGIQRSHFPGELSPQGICRHPGSPMTCCISANWLSCDIN